MVPDWTPAGSRAVPAEWDEFDREARSKLLAVFAYAAGDGIDPDDVVQDVLIAARAHFVPLGSYAVMFAWCRSRGVFTILNVRNRGYGRWERPHSDPGAAVAEGVGVPGVDGAATDKALVDAVLAQLPADDRAVLVLARADLTPQQIATALGIRPGAARVRLLRARRRFRTQMGDSAPLLVPGGWPLRRAALRADLPALAGHSHGAAVSLTAAGLAVAVAAVLGATAPSAESAASDAAGPQRHDFSGSVRATQMSSRGQAESAATVVGASPAARSARRPPDGRPPEPDVRPWRPATRIAACAVTVCVRWRRQARRRGHADRHRGPVRARRDAGDRARVPARRPQPRGHLHPTEARSLDRERGSFQPPHRRDHPMRTTLLAAVLAAPLLTVAPAASATPGSPGLGVWIEDWTPTGATVCADGKVHEGTGGVWRLTVAGARSDGTWISPPVVVRTGPSFPLTCFGVSMAGAPYGSFTGTLTYTIAGAAERSEPSAGLADLAGLAGFAAAWTATHPPADFSYTTGS